MTGQNRRLRLVVNNTAATAQLAAIPGGEPPRFEALQARVVSAAQQWAAELWITTSTVQAWTPEEVARQSLLDAVHELDGYLAGQQTLFPADSP